MPITDALPDMKRELKFFPVENENPQKTDGGTDSSI